MTGYAVIIEQGMTDYGAYAPELPEVGVAGSSIDESGTPHPRSDRPANRQSAPAWRTGPSAIRGRRDGRRDPVCLTRLGHAQLIADKHQPHLPWLRLDPGVVLGTAEPRA